MVRFSYTRNLIGTTWDIKRPRINSPYSSLRYWKRDKNKKMTDYWTALIKIRIIMRKFLDNEWKKNGNKIKTKEDFRKYIQTPAEKKIERYFHKSIFDLHTGKFGDTLIKKYS